MPTLTIAKALRRVYDVNTPQTTAGTVRAEIQDANARQQLASDGTGHDIVYISTIMIDESRPPDAAVQPGMTVSPHRFCQSSNRASS